MQLIVQFQGRDGAAHGGVRHAAGEFAAAEGGDASDPGSGDFAALIADPTLRIAPADTFAGSPGIAADTEPGPHRETDALDAAAAVTGEAKSPAPEIAVVPAARGVAVAELSFAFPARGGAGTGAARPVPAAQSAETGTVRTPLHVQGVISTRESSVPVALAGPDGALAAEPQAAVRPEGRPGLPAHAEPARFRSLRAASEASLSPALPSRAAAPEAAADDPSVRLVASLAAGGSDESAPMVSRAASSAVPAPLAATWRSAPPQTIAGAMPDPAQPLAGSIRGTSAGNPWVQTSSSPPPETVPAFRPVRPETLLGTPASDKLVPASEAPADAPPKPPVRSAAAAGSAPVLDAVTGPAAAHQVPSERSLQRADARAAGNGGAHGTPAVRSLAPDPTPMNASAATALPDQLQAPTELHSGASEGGSDPNGPIGQSEGAETRRAPMAATRLEMPARPVIAQIAEAVRSTAGGGVELRLSPEELGRVRLSMTAGDAGMIVHVVAERPETLDLIRRHIDMLDHALRREGFSDLSFSFGQNRGSEPGNRGPDGNSEADRPDGPAPRAVERLDTRLAPRTADGRMDLRF